MCFFPLFSFLYCIKYILSPAVTFEWIGNAKATNYRAAFKWYMWMYVRACVCLQFHVVDICKKSTRIYNDRINYFGGARVYFWIFPFSSNNTNDDDEKNGTLAIGRHHHAIRLQTKLLNCIFILYVFVYIIYSETHTQHTSHSTQSQQSSQKSVHSKSEYSAFTISLCSIFIFENKNKIKCEWRMN